MALSALNLLSGIAAASAGLAGEKVSKDGTVPGLKLAAIVPALLGKSGGTTGVLSGVLASMAKTGLLGGSGKGNLAELAASLFSFGKAGNVKNPSGSIESLAAAIAGNSGSGPDLGSIAAMASNLAKSAEDQNELKDMASGLGNTLSSAFGVSMGGKGTVLNAMNKAVGSDIKGELFKTVLEGLV